MYQIPSVFVMANLDSFLTEMIKLGLWWHHERSWEGLKSWRKKSQVRVLTLPVINKLYQRIFFNLKYYFIKNNICKEVITICITMLISR